MAAEPQNRLPFAARRRGCPTPTRFFTIIVREAVRCRLLSMTTRPDHLGKKVGVVIDLIRHLAPNIEQYFQKLGPPVHLLIVNGEFGKYASALAVYEKFRSDDDRRKEPGRRVEKFYSCLLPDVRKVTEIPGD